VNVLDKAHDMATLVFWVDKEVRGKDGTFYFPHANEGLDRSINPIEIYLHKLDGIASTDLIL